MFGLGPGEVILIIGVILMLFGPSRLPEMGKALGSGIKEFKKATTSMKEAISPEAGGTTEK